MESLVIGSILVSGDQIPVVSTKLEIIDFLGAVRVRWGLRRDNYRVVPGIYAVGLPDENSDVFVTANYKLSFDHVRKSLAGMSGWILVLDTKGVNVWCAAGKGTFGTNELINRIKIVSLESIVKHKRIILPQLGAVGVAAHKIKEETGFNVHYGPVRASDIKRFVNEGYRADKMMRQVTFNLTDRLKLIPNDFIYNKFYLLGAIIVVLLISSISTEGISVNNVMNNRGISLLNVFLAYIAGIVFTPLFLPLIPVRSFALKGFISGVLLFIILVALNLAGENIFEKLSWFFITGTISSFLAMNFTGSSTYTSLSGVKKEMKISLPVQIGFAIAGVILQLVGRLI
jgi:hypothetical protein